MNNLLLNHDYDTFFLTKDALNSVNYDLCFSPLKKYTCRTNCSVCYIKSEIQSSLNNYEDIVSDTITDQSDQEWKNIFEYFNVVRTADDLDFVKKHYINTYNWYKNNANLLEYSTTDNGIFVQNDLILNDLTFKGIYEISVSDIFLHKFNKSGKVLSILKEWNSKYYIRKYKFIQTQTELNKTESDVIKWFKDTGIPNMIHCDFRKQTNEAYDSLLLNDDDNLYKIYDGAFSLQNNQFFFTTKEASDFSKQPFYTYDHQFEPIKFLLNVMKSKLHTYKRFGYELSHTNTGLGKIFRDYFNNTSKFRVNDDFNFIPNFMLNESSKFYNKLLQSGFEHTKHGLLKSNSNKCIPICEYFDK